MERATSRAEAVEARWAHGYHWSGGAVGGNPRYYQPAQTYRGLVSDEHPVLQAFVQRVPRAGLAAHRLQTGATKAEATQGDSKLLALDSAYVSANTRMRGILRVELDADFASFTAVRAACDTVGVPEPNVVVGHVRADGAALHPHLIWILADPVTFCGRGRPEYRALWHKVLRGLTFALAAAGADPGGLSNPLRVKNPLCPVWSRHVAVERPYSLGELARHVRLDVTDDELKTGRPPALGRSPETIIDPEAGSNALFVALRDRARSIVADRLAAGVGREEFRAELVMFALTLADAAGRSEAQVCGAAVRVADYVLERAAHPPLPPDEVRRRQAAAGRDTAADRRAATVQALVAAYRRLVADGTKPTQAAVAAAARRSERTARACWRAVLDSVTANENRPEPAERSPSVKKGTGASAPVEAMVHSVSRERSTAARMVAAVHGLPALPALLRPITHLPVPAFLRPAAPATPAHVPDAPSTSAPVRPAQPDFRRAFAALRLSGCQEACSTAESRAKVYAAWRLLHPPTAASSHYLVRTRPQRCGTAEGQHSGADSSAVFELFDQPSARFEDYAVVSNRVVYVATTSTEPES